MTIDALYNAASAILFSPSLVLLYLPSLYLTGYKPSDLIFRIAFLYTFLVCLFNGLLYFDYWYRQSIIGPKRKITWSSELIVVTGGASGLGASIVSLLAQKGTNIAVLDIRTYVTVTSTSNIKSYFCDVSDSNQLERAYTSIERDFTMSPSILISNAGMMKSGSIIASPISEIDSIISINFRAQFLLAKVFLPGIIERKGQVVTISSSLASVGVSHLSAYCASKAGTTSFHESLTAELLGTGVVTTLISPGQINTSMFSSLSTPSSFFAPVLDTYELAETIISKVAAREGGEFGYPLYARYIPLMRVLPSGLQVFLRRVSGMDQAVRKGERWIDAVIIQ